MEEQDFITNVIQWAKDRNIIDGSSLDAQYLKLIEEIGEIAAAKARGNREAMIDGIGDAMVVCVIMGKIGREAGWKSPVWVSIGVLARLSDVVRSSTVCVFARSVFVRLCDFAVTEGIDPSEAMQSAWVAIKDRKGKLIDGVFVKESE